MAFQLVDDLLDLTSTQETLGKPVANDLKEGKVTLPVSFVMRNGMRGDAERVRTVLQERAFRFGRKQRHPSTASRRATVFVKLVPLQRITRERRKRMLEVFPPSPYRDAIVHIPEFILNRTA